MVERRMLEARRTHSARLAIMCRRAAMQILGEGSGKHEFSTAGRPMEKQGMRDPVVGDELMKLSLLLFMRWYVGEFHSYKFKDFFS